MGNYENIYNLKDQKDLWDIENLDININFMVLPSEEVILVNIHDNNSVVEKQIPLDCKEILSKTFILEVYSIHA